MAAWGREDGTRPGKGRCGPGSSEIAGQHLEDGVWGGRARLQATWLAFPATSPRFTARPEPRKAPSPGRRRLHLMQRQEGHRAPWSGHSQPLPAPLESPPHKGPQMAGDGAPRRALGWGGAGGPARGQGRAWGWARPWRRRSGKPHGGHRKEDEDPVTPAPLVGVSLKETEARSRGAVGSPVSPAAPLPGAEIGRQPRCPWGTAGGERGRPHRGRRWVPAQPGSHRA